MVTGTAEHPIQKYCSFTLRDIEVHGTLRVFMTETIQGDLMEKMTFELALEECRQHGQADMKKETSKFK